MDDLISRQAAIDAMATWDWQELYLPIHFKQLLEELPSVSAEKGAQHLEDIANGKFNEPYTCVSIKLGNETRHICVVNCSRVCHNPRCACEKNKDACPNCGARMRKGGET